MALIDSNFELQNIMLSVLAKMSAIKFANFGLSCFRTLKDLLCSSRELEDAVIEVINNEIVVTLVEAESPLSIPVTTL